MEAGHELTTAAREDLRFARALLESTSLAVRIADVLGTPVERGLAALPERWREGVQKATRKALERALDTATRSLGEGRRGVPSRDRLHQLAVAGSGALGGTGGLLTLAAELPLTTTLMLRSIADVARSEGEDPRTVETRLACLEVFALGGPSSDDDAAETGYFGVRAALAKVVGDAARHLAGRSAADASAPALVRLIAAIGSRFGVVVSEKAAAQAVPVIGAAGGAVVNTLFLDHFQRVARGHFVVRRLEREFGEEAVRTAWGEIGAGGVGESRGERKKE